MISTLPVGFPGLSLDETSLETQRTGGECGLSAICRAFGANVPVKLPQLINDRIIIPLKTYFPGLTTPLSDAKSGSSLSVELIQEIVNSMQILEKIIEHLHPDTHALMLALLPNIAMGIQHELTAVRHVTARLIASMAVVCEDKVMQFLVEETVGILGSVDSQVTRQGAIEVIG